MKEPFGALSLIVKKRFMESLKKNKKIFFNIGLLIIFIWLLITSYSQSKRKPENFSDLFNDFSWLGGKCPKWLDLPLMKWINIGFKALNEKYGYIFEAINNFLLYILMLVKNFLIQAPWPFRNFCMVINSKLQLIKKKT